MAAGVSIFGAAALLVAAQSPAPAPPNSATARVDALFSGFTAQGPGCVVQVAKDGAVLVDRAYGMADLEDGRPLTTDSVLEIGSVSKQFTAMAILLLEQDGKLKLTDDIRRYLPEMPDYGDPITIQHLLNHTSGLRDWGSVSAAAGHPRTIRQFGQPTIVAIAARQKALNFKPGESFSYSNTNYNLLVEIVARVSGATFQAFTAERMFKPLGMTRAQWRDDYRKVVPGRAQPYIRTAEGFLTAIPIDNSIGNGGLMTTAGEMMRWQQALAAGTLGPEMSGRLEEPGVLNDGRSVPYARGLVVDEYKGHARVSHDGSTGGYNAWVARYPAERLAVVLLCNTAIPVVLPGEIADAFLPPAPPTAAAEAAGQGLSFPDATPYAGVFANQLTGLPLTFAAAGPDLVDRGVTLKRIGPSQWRTAAGGTIEYRGTDGFRVTSPVGWSDYVRVSGARPTAQDLAEYAGTYVSDEAGATYKVTVEGGQLVVAIDHWPGMGWRPAPIYKDGFLSGGRLIRFHRNGAGRIEAMSLGDVRMWDLRARRLAGSP